MPRAKSDAEKNVRESISFEPQQLRDLIAFCQKHDRTMSWVVRRALRDYLEKHKDDPAD